MNEPSASRDLGEGSSAELALWTAYKAGGSRAAREELFDLHATFARNIARRHFRERSRGDVDLQDFYQLAYMGLLEALDRFDPRHGTPFRAYASHRISGNVRDGILRMTEVREQLAWRKRLHRERLQSISDRSDGRQPIERLTDLVVGLALGFMLEGTGLYVQDAEETVDQSRNAKTAYDSVAWKELTGQLKREMQKLPKREQDILQKHYLEGVGFDDLAALFGLTKGRISQIHRSALLALKRRLSDLGHAHMGNLTG